MAQRQYEAATVFNARIADMRHLWEPSRMYKGQPTQKPNFFAMFLVKKTVAQWTSEPALAGIAAACGKIYQTNPHILIWPVVDGDMPSVEGKSSEFAKGHWLFSGSSGNAPNVELVQAGGSLVKLQNKVNVKSGDYVMAGVTAAVKQNDPRGVKLYLNAVVFTSPGEEIVFANSVSGAELMRMAEQQGLRPAGFSPTPGGFAPQGPGGFPYQPPQHGGPGGFQPPQGNFPGQQGAPGFSPGPAPAPGQGTFAPQQNNTAGGFAPQQGNGATAFPSNQGPPNFNPGGPYQQR